MPSTLHDAHRQWVSRSPDEQFASLDQLLAFTNSRRQSSIETSVPLGFLRVCASDEGELRMNGHVPASTPTNWAFSQLCQRVGAPAAYLRSLPPAIVAQCLDHGMGLSSEECRVLIRTGEDSGASGPNLAAAFTSTSYGRIWDDDVLAALLGAIDGGAWRTPPSPDALPRGLYASDRDMFVFLINDEQPIEVGNARLSKGFFCWNSETGAASFGLTTFLFNHACSNGLVWGADQVEELRIIHRHRAPSRFYDEAVPVLNRFAEDRKLDDRIKDTVYAAMNRRIGSTCKDVVDFLKDKPFTGREIDRAWDASVGEGDDPTTLWGLVQGLTSVARTIPFADKRVNLERRAGALLR